MEQQQKEKIALEEEIARLSRSLAEMKEQQTEQKQKEIQEKSALKEEIARLSRSLAEIQEQQTEQQEKEILRRVLRVETSRGTSSVETSLETILQASQVSP